MTEALSLRGVGEEPPSARLAGLARAGAVLAVSSVVANLLGYSFAVVLSRALGPGGYGALAALLALGLIGSIPAIALQLLVAREVANDSAAAAIWVRTAAVIGTALLALFIVLAPFVRGYLGLSGPFPVMWLGVSLLPTTVTGALQGVLLGRQLYGRLAASYVLLAGMRFAGGCIAAASGATVGGALAAAAAGTAVAFIITARLTPSGVPEGLGPAPRITFRRRAHAMAAAASATAAILVLTNLDVIMARHYLTPFEAGHYGVGALFAKAAFWGPHFLAVLAFPHLSRHDSRRRFFLTSATLTVALGGIVVVGAAALAEPVIRMTVGGAYVDVAPLAAWFSVLGLLAAVLQLLLFSGLARRNRRVEALVWIGIAVDLVVVSLWFHDSAHEIVLASITVAATLSVVVALVEIRSAAAAATPSVSPGRALHPSEHDDH